MAATNSFLVLEGQGRAVEAGRAGANVLVAATNSFLVLEGQGRAGQGKRVSGCH